VATRRAFVRVVILAFSPLLQAGSAKDVTAAVCSGEADRVMTPDEGFQADIAGVWFDASGEKLFTRQEIWSGHRG
jgi:hypothetical protein